MCATPKTCSPSLAWGPPEERVTFSSFPPFAFAFEACQVSKIKDWLRPALYRPDYISPEISIYSMPHWSKKLTTPISVFPPILRNLKESENNRSPLSSINLLTIFAAAGMHAETFVHVLKGPKQKRRLLVWMADEGWQGVKAPNPIDLLTAVRFVVSDRRIWGAYGSKGHKTKAPWSNVGFRRVCLGEATQREFAGTYDFDTAPLTAHGVSNTETRWYEDIYQHNFLDTASS